jgi:hypothetical protein
MPVFGTESKKQLEKAHPKLQLVLNKAILHIDFKILDSTRGRHAQTKAFLTGHSKAKFGQSAHNYVPSIAVDLFPAPYKWEGPEASKAFKSLYFVMMACAKELGVPIRSGLDWNMNGLQPGDTDNWDGGHYELHPWRTWAKQSKLFED